MLDAAGVARRYEELQEVSLHVAISKPEAMLGMLKTTLKMLERDGGSVLLLTMLSFHNWVSGDRE
jgi:hypothetical protein